MAIKEHQNLSYFVNDEEKKIENFIEDENKFLEGLEAIDLNSWDEVKELLEKGYKVVLFDNNEFLNIVSKNEHTSRKYLESQGIDVDEIIKKGVKELTDKTKKQNPNH